MGILNYLVFDNINSYDFGFYISGEGVYNAPSRNVEAVSIPGRNGDLMLDLKSFENISVVYPAFNYETTYAGFTAAMDTIRNAFASKVGYQRLTDTFHPDEFRLATFRSGLEVDPIMYNSGAKFDLEFDCKPQRFLVSGETPQTFTASGSITNPTQFPADPLLEVVGTGKVTIGAYSFEISSNPGRIYIDADIMEAWSLSGSTKISQNGSVAYTDHKTPKIDPGTVAVTLGTGITELKITPRWWRI